MTPNEKLEKLHNDLESVAMYYKRYLEPVDLDTLTKHDIFTVYTRSSGIYSKFQESIKDISFIPDEMMPAFVDLVCILEERIRLCMERSCLAWQREYGTLPIKN